MNFSFQRFLAMLRKEFLQMRRDRFTVALIVGMPLVQLLLFGFAINTDPKHLPAALVTGDQSRYQRTLVTALTNSGYFDFRPLPFSQEEAAEGLALGQLQFVLNVPVDFSRSVDRGDRPLLLLEADATDPTAIGNALSAVAELAPTLLERDLPGVLRAGPSAPPPFGVELHKKYNPEGLTTYNIVPGLIGTILTFTMVVITALAVTRERERGTMENLLAMPVTPLEVMLGKIVPYILLGYVQIAIVLTVAVVVFGVPVRGSVPLLLVGLGFFIAANLSVGFTFSTLARNQLQAMQLAVFFVLPSILLSGFMFPFQGMPGWAQALGELLPLTHMLRLTRGLLLKGNGVVALLHHVWPLILFSIVVGAVAIRNYRTTLD
ncbi:MAG: ABC transporter permease [Myxococcaceae bacterium]